MAASDIDINDCIIYFKTDKINELYNLFEVMAKLNPDSFITFYKGTIDKPGKIEIKDTDTKQVVLYKLIIPQQNLMEYHCFNDVYSIKLDFNHIIKILKPMKQRFQQIKFCILKCREQEICIYADSKDGVINTSHTISLSTDKYEPIGDFTTEFNCSIRINTDNFHSTCNSLSNFGDFLNITCETESLIISVKDSETSRTSNTTRFNASNSSTNKSIINITFTDNFINENPLPVIESTYSASNISSFEKLKQYAPMLDIRMSNNNDPLCLIYNIQNLGLFVVFIVAINQEND